MSENELTYYADTSGNAVARFTGFESRESKSGARVDAMSALFIPAYFRALQLKADTIATMDTVVAKRYPGGGWQPAEEHPLFHVLRYRPNNEQTALKFKQALLWHAIGRGSGYAVINYDGGRPAIRLLDPRTTAPTVQDGRLQYRVIHQGQQRFIDSGSVIHIHGPGFTGSDGYDAVEIGSETLGLATAQAGYESSLLRNAAMPAGFFRPHGTMDEEGLKEWMKVFNEVHRGFLNPGQMAALFDMDFVKTGLSPIDMQLTGARNFVVAEISRLTGVPAWLLDVDGANQPASVEEGMRLFHKLTLKPWVQGFDQELTIKLLRPSEIEAGYFIFNDAENLLEGDIKTQIAKLTALYQMSGLAPDEARIKFGMRPFGNSITSQPHVQDNNMKPVGDRGTDKPHDHGAGGRAALVPPATGGLRSFTDDSISDLAHSLVVDYSIPTPCSNG